MLLKKAKQYDRTVSLSLVYGEKYGYHTHCLPLQDAVDYLSEQFELMKTASLTVDRDMTICQCEYRKEGEQE